MEYGNGNDLVNEVRAATGTGTWHVDLGLRAGNEGDQYQWKKFLPSGAHLDVVYNLPPNMPVLHNHRRSPTATPRAVVPATVRTTTPTLSGTVSIPTAARSSVTSGCRTPPRPRS